MSERTCWNCGYVGEPGEDNCPSCGTVLISAPVYMTLLAGAGLFSGAFLGFSLWVYNQAENVLLLIVWALFNGPMVFKISPLSRIWLYTLVLLISGFVSFALFMDSL